MDFTFIPYINVDPKTGAKKGGISFSIQEDASDNSDPLYEENDIMQEIESNNWAFLDRALEKLKHLTKKD